MATRRYDFATGIESSDAPSGTDPVSGSDFINQSYGEKTYALRADFGYDVASYAALKALATTGNNARADGQVRLVTGTGELWYFDADSVATDDGTSILQPDSGSGRWLIASSAGATSSGSGGPDLQALAQKTALEQDAGFLNPAYDNSLQVVAIGEQPFNDVTGNLLSTYSASGQTEVAIVWGAQVLSTSDRNIDSTTSWTAVQDGTSLTATSTAGEFKVGAAALKFNKSNTATRAGIRFDRGSANFNIANNYRLFFWIKLPSLTNLSNVYVRMYDSGTTNYDEFTATTDLEGNALVADWNLMFFDLSGTPSSVGSSGWTLSTLSRYFEVGVTASSSAQTYTGIIVDSIYFGYADVARLGVEGAEHTFFDSSNKQSLVISTSSPSGDGLVTLASPTTVAMNGGQTSSNTFVERSVLEFSNNKIVFDSDFSSGTIATSQEYRASRTLRESVNGTIDGFVEFDQPEQFRITGVSAGSITGEDFSIVSGNCLSGDVFDVYSVYYDRHNVDYIYKTNVTLTANATAVTGNSQIILSVADSTSVSAGDFLSKRSLTSSISMVNLNGNESFSSFTFKDSPDGRILFDEGLAVPFKNDLDYHAKIGGLSDAFALRNRGATGTAVNLTKTGTPTLNYPIRRGMYGMTSSNSSNYLQTPSDTALSVFNGNATQTIEALFWFKRGNNSNANCGVFYMVDSFATNANGFIFYLNLNSGNIQLVGRTASASQTVTLTTVIPKDKWVLVYFYQNETGNQSVIWCNGAVLDTSAPGQGGNNNQFRFGMVETTGNEDSIFSELLIYGSVGYRLFSNTTLINMQQRGPRPFDQAFINRYQYRQTAQSGQKLSMKVAASKASTSFNGPSIYRFGAIKI